MQQGAGDAFHQRFAAAETGEVTLASGVRVFLERDPLSPVVGIGWMVPSGSARDPPGKRGLAHLTEHLIFRAPRAGGASSTDFYDQSGVRFRGQTSADATKFTVTVHSERLAELLRFELARIADPLSSLSAAQVTHETRIVQEEAASQRPQWRQATMNALFTALYPGGFCLASDNGDPSMDEVTIEDVKQFVADNYRPGSIELFVTGAFSWNQIEALLGPVKHMDPSLPRNLGLQLAHAPTPPPAKPIDRLIRQEGFVADNLLYVGWPLPPHVEMVGIEPLLVPLIRTVLPRIEGPSMGKYPAWLPQGPLGEKQVQLISTKRGGVLLVSAQLPPRADPSKVAARIIHEVDSLAGKIEHNPRTFAFVQYRVTKNHLQEAEDLDYRLARMMRQHELGDFGLPADYFRNLNALTALQAAAFSRAWLRGASARVVLVTPRVATAAPAPLSIKIPTKVTPTVDTPAAPLGATPAALYPGSRFVWRKLANGMETAVMSRPNSTVNTLLLGVRATARNPDLEPIDSFVEVARRTPTCPDSAMACYGDVDATSLRALVSTLKTDVQQGARFLLGVATAPRYEWTPAAKDLLGPLFEKREAMPEAVARRAFLGELWGEHPRGRSLSTDLLKRVTLLDLIHWEEANIRPENALVIAVTNDDPDEIADILSTALRPWTVRRPPSPMPAPSVPELHTPHPLRILLAADPSIETARLAFGCLIPPLTSFTDRVAAEMLGDWVQRLLFRELRTQSDASYATATKVKAYSSGETSMQGLMDVNMEYVGQAMALFRELFDRPHRFDEHDANHMKELRMRKVALQNLTGADIAFDIFDRWSFHMGNPTPLGELEEVRQVSVHQLDTLWDVCRQNAVLQVTSNRMLNAN